VWNRGRLLAIYTNDSRQIDTRGGAGAGCQTGPVTSRDWHEWHRPYDDPGSSLARRLVIVQRFVRAAIDRLAPGPVRVISMCGGQGRDLFGALATHPRRGDVVGRLVELDERNAEAARVAAATAGMGNVEVRTGDAAVTDAYAGAVPADLVLACGIFGNLADEDVARTIAHLPQLCATGGTVLWTRHRRPPDLTVDIRRWFAEQGFEELEFEAPPETRFGVGAHRLVAAHLPLRAGVRLFAFLEPNRP
jgi:hypothetical protein